MCNLYEASAAWYTDTKEVMWYPAVQNDTITPFINTDTL